MPEVDVAWSCSGDEMQSLTVTQHNVLNEGLVWPMAMEVGLYYPDGSKWDMPLEINAAATKSTARLPTVIGPARMDIRQRK